MALTCTHWRLFGAPKSRKVSTHCGQMSFSNAVTKKQFFCITIMLLSNCTDSMVVNGVRNVKEWYAFPLL